jgi:uncharacterized protein (TIGR02466 family)
MPIHPLFPVPLYVNPDCAEQNKLDLGDINKRLLNLDWERVYNPDPTYEPKGSTTVNKDILKLPEFADVRIAVENEMRKFIFDALHVDPSGIRLDCNRSWSMLHKRGDYSHSHCHENCLWSGILYTRMPDNCGGLNFYKEPLRYTWILPAIKPQLKTPTDITSNEIYTSPNEGCILIFPAFMYHGTPPNNSDEDRLNIVFNYSLKGEFGDNYYERQSIR